MFCQMYLVVIRKSNECDYWLRQKYQFNSIICYVQWIFVLKYILYIVNYTDLTWTYNLTLRSIHFKFIILTMVCIFIHA